MQYPWLDAGSHNLRDYPRGVVGLGSEVEDIEVGGGFESRQNPDEVVALGTWKLQPREVGHASGVSG